jgi:hypothetical protein
LDDEDVVGLDSECVSRSFPGASSASSVISSSFRREELEEQLDGAAVWSEHAAARAESLSSSAEAMDMVMSCGVNFSAT